MTRRSEPDQTPTHGEQLHGLLAEALALADEQLEVETPDPAAWVTLAQRTYTFRSSLPTDDATQDDLRAFALELEHALLARSRLESQPPQRVLFFGQTLIEARRVFDGEMTSRLMPLAAALAEEQSS